MQRIYRWLTILGFLGATLSLGACSEIMGDVQDNVQKSFQVEPGGKLTLDSDLGSIDVSTSSSTSISVEIQRDIRANDKKEADGVLKDFVLDMHQSGKDVFIKAEYHRGRMFDFDGRRLKIRFLITVPKKYHLDLKTGGGSIRITELDGSVVARTSGGSLHFGQINGPVNGNTSGGSINLEGCSGAVEVNTSGGSIRIGKVTGTVNAHTSGGSINVDEVLGTIRASTSGGSVSATISKQPEANCELSTSGGSVRVTLSKNLNLNLRAKCSGGSIHTGIPLTVQGEISKTHLEAKLNNGGPELYLHTSGGGVYLEETR